jgi:hypothetical protein
LFVFGAVMLWLLYRSVAARGSAVEQSDELQATSRAALDALVEWFIVYDAYD